jgi:hypothetical protein
MTPHDLIDRYAYDVSRRLPQRMRADVNGELRALLHEELASQPDADLDAAKALLVKFGAPDEVAARYAPPALVVEARDTHLFWRVNAWIAGLVGVFAFVAGVAGPAPLSAAASGAFIERTLQGVGFVTLIFWLVGYARRRSTSKRPWNPAQLPRVRDRDHINRVGNALAIAYFTVGAIILSAPATFLNLLFGGKFPPAAQAALT